MSNTPVLRLRGITKHFGPLAANDDISLTLGHGEMLALLGENGAGKTTLMSILFGHYVADSGSVEIRGNQLPPGSPRAALAAGKRVVLVPAGKSWGNTLPGAYATDFWNWPMFNNTPGTMGLLCDPNHPALAAFPTRFHSERQWSEIAHASRPVILSATRCAPRPSTSSRARQNS